MRYELCLHMSCHDIRAWSLGVMGLNTKVIDRYWH